MLVCGEPVERRAGILDRLGITARTQRIRERAAIALAAHGGDQAGCDFAAHRHGYGLLPGAADHSGAYTKGMAGQVDARHKAAHGVSKDHVGNLLCGEARRKLAGHATAQLVHVGYKDILPAAPGHVAQIGLRGGGESVADMVVRADREPLAAQVLGKRCVALDMLGHTVHDLHDAARRRVPGMHVLRLPQQGANSR